MQNKSKWVIEWNFMWIIGGHITHTRGHFGLAIAIYSRVSVSGDLGSSGITHFYFE